MPEREAKTMAMLSSMQEKMSARTTVPVTLEGSTWRTKKMRAKEMMETLVLSQRGMKGQEEIKEIGD
ncbi:MAG: hypothetical protein Q9203_003338 [Teloschistes exilis]